MGPKRAGKIRKLWNLEKKDDVRQYVIRRVIPKKEGSKRKKDRVIVPKIQRLVTPKKVARAARKERVQKVALQKSKVGKKKERRKETVGCCWLW
jgi:small subunit ribosomal protein S6e